MRNIYVFGNEFLEDDSFAKEVGKHLKDFNIINCTSPEVLLEKDEEELLILDVVKNTKEVMVITDIHKLKTKNILSMHDFDVSFFLKLLNEMGIGKKIKIIGVPEKGIPEETAKEVEKCI